MKKKTAGRSHVSEYEMLYKTMKQMGVFSFEAFPMYLAGISDDSYLLKKRSDLISYNKLDPFQ